MLVNFYALVNLLLVTVGTSYLNVPSKSNLSFGAHRKSKYGCKYLYHFYNFHSNESKFYNSINLAQNN